MHQGRQPRAPIVICHHAQASRLETGDSVNLAFRQRYRRLDFFDKCLVFAARRTPADERHAAA